MYKETYNESLPRGRSKNAKPKEVAPIPSDDSLESIVDNTW